MSNKIPPQLANIKHPDNQVITWDELFKLHEQLARSVLTTSGAASFAITELTKKDVANTDSDGSKLPEIAEFAEDMAKTINETSAELLKIKEELKGKKGVIDATSPEMMEYAQIYDRLVAVADRIVGALVPAGKSMEQLISVGPETDD